MDMIIVHGYFFFGPWRIYYLSGRYFVNWRTFIFCQYFSFFKANSSASSISGELRGFIILSKKWIISELVWWWYTNLECLANVCYHSMKIVPSFPYSFISLRSYIPFFWNEEYSKLLEVISPKWKIDLQVGSKILKECTKTDIGYGTKRAIASNMIDWTSTSPVISFSWKQSGSCWTAMNTIPLR